MEKFKSRNKGIEAANRVALWLLILTGIVFFGLLNLKRIKTNYTNLHWQVTDNTRRITDLERGE